MKRSLGAIPCLGIAVVMAAALLTAPLFAQTGLGIVKGTVLDATGAAIPAAHVTLVNTQTNVSRESQSSAVGVYEFPAVPIGSYKLTVQAEGFKRYEGTFDLQAGQTVSIDPALEVGAVDTVVEVTGVAPTITTTGMEVSDVKDSLRIRQLPLNGRAITNLFDLTPGVEGGGNPRVNGMKVGSTEMSLDGVSLVDRFGGGISRVQPGLDTVEEFRVETAGSNARNSRPATITLVTKSGTNEFHGSAFATHRNNAAGLRARQRQDGNSAAKLIRNEFGVSGGGPIIHDKTFFFAAYEGSRVRQNQFSETSVPLPGMWNGDMGNLFPDLENLTTVYDPFSTNAQGLRELFPNEIIPQSRLSDYGKAMHALTPDATNSVNPFEGPNFQNYYPATNDTNQFTIKGDHVLTERDNLTGRFTRDSNSNILQGGRYGYPPPGCDNCGGSGLSDAKVYNGMFRWTHTFSPTLISETQLSNHRSVKDSGTLGNNTPWADMLGLPNPFDVTGWPTICGAYPFLYYGCWDGDNRKDENLTSYQIDENITWIKGKHSMQFGTKLRQEYNNIQELQQAQGSHGFYSDWTSQWDPANESAVPFTGFELASTLLGTPTQLRNQANRGFFYFQQFELGLYFQDSWKVSPRLTLDIGLRYDRWAPYGEKRNRLSNLDLSTINNTFQVVTPGSTRAEDISGILPSMLQSYANRGLSWVTADSIGFPSHLVPADNNNFGPRIGAAYRVTDKLVIRGGYGEYFWTMPLSQILQAARTNPPFNLRFVNLIVDHNGNEPYYALTHAPQPNEILPNAKVDVNSAAGISSNALSMDVWDINNWKDNRMQNWNFTVEHEIMRDTALRLSYIGTHGSDLEQKFEVNSRESEWNYQARTGLAVPGRRDDLRVNKDWAPRGTNHTGYSNSNSLQAEIERRYSNGLAFQWFYTFTRALTTSDAGGFSSGGGSINASGSGAVLSVPEVTQLLGAPNLSYSDRLRLGYQNSGDVPAHRIRWNAIYDLPFGKGKKFGNSASGVLNQFIGGWQLASIGSWRSGLWKNVDSSRYLFGDPTLSKDQRLEVTFGGRQQLVYFRGDFNPGSATGVDQAALQQLVPADRGQRTLRPLNPDRGDNSLPEVLADGSIRFTPLGDTVNWNSRNFFQGAGFWDVDLSVFKTFNITEDMNVRFTADFFNAFNTPMDPDPNATSGLQDLGRQTNDPRIIQFSLRFSW
jgi:Carboxypeptidase regulatory-like domain/TonB dependent receptor-like, beta-barrel